MSFCILTVPSVETACSTCDPLTSFSCLSSTQYVKCNATTLDFTTVFVCPTSSVCNESMPLALPFSSIPCYVNATGSNVTVVTSCDRPQLRFLANTASFNATTFCAIRSIGVYMHPEKTDCTTYVRCYQDIVLRGAEYTCPGMSRFNNKTLECDQNKTC